MKTRIKWVQDAEFVGESGSGHSVVMDGPPDFGGKNRGVRPMEMILLGLGACTGYDIVSILKKARQEVTGIEISVDGKRADAVPSVFTDINIHFHITGHNVSEKQVDRAIHLSAEKYCSASIMLGKAVNITHTFEVSDSE